MLGTAKCGDRERKKVYDTVHLHLDKKMCVCPDSVSPFRDLSCISCDFSPAERI